MLPLRLALESRDKNALDALSTSTSIVVALRRRVKYYYASSSARQHVAWNEIEEDVGAAVWWPSHEDDRNDHSTRHMEGEIRLAKDLRPTSAMGHYSLSVRIYITSYLIMY